MQEVNGITSFLGHSMNHTVDVGSASMLVLRFCRELAVVLIAYVATFGK